MCSSDLRNSTDPPAIIIISINRIIKRKPGSRNLRWHGPELVGSDNLREWLRLVFFRDQVLVAHGIGVVAYVGNHSGCVVRTHKTNLLAANFNFITPPQDRRHSSSTQNHFLKQREKKNKRNSEW